MLVLLAVPRLVLRHELGQVWLAQRGGLLGEVLVGAQVVNPQLRGPRCSPLQQFQCFWTREPVVVLTGLSFARFASTVL